VIVNSSGFRLPDVDLALQDRPELLIVLGLAFPHGDTMPSELLEFGSIPLVAGDITLELLFPEFCIRHRVRCTRAIVTMPKAAVDEQRDRPPREDEIGCTRKIAPVEAMSEAQGVRGLPDPQLGRGVLGTHPGHVP
jgi:hypothetical protein